MRLIRSAGILPAVAGASRSRNLVLPAPRVGPCKLQLLAWGHTAVIPTGAQSAERRDPQLVLVLVLVLLLVLLLILKLETRN